jgi:iron complex outermembrane recepter protein
MKRIFFACCFFSIIQSYGQQTDTTELIPVEIRATRASATAPFAKTNIGKAELTRQNLGQDLPFFLNQVPSAVVNSDAGNGVGYTGLRIRGTDATRINVTLNGIPYNDAESQGTFFVNLPDFVSSVNSMQIQRGVGTSTNGPGSFGATVNVSTHEISKKSYAEINNSFGSFNTLKNTIRVGTGLLKDHLTADLRVSRITSNGFIDRASSNLKALYFSTAYLSDKSQVRFNFFTGKEKTYQAWYGIPETDVKANRTANYAGTEKPGDPYDNETDNYRQDHYQLFFTQKISPLIDFNTGFFYTKGKGFYEQYKANRKYADYNIQPSAGSTITKTDLVRQLWLDNDFYGGIFSIQYKKQKTELVLGGNVSRYDGNHYGTVTWAKEGFTSMGNWYDNDAFKNDLNVYGKWQQELLPSLLFFTDLQLRKVKYTINGFRDNPSLQVNNNYSFFNPKIGLSYQKNNWLMYGSYSVGQKEPNRDDFEAGITNSVKPERLNDIEIGIENKNASRTFAANVFYMKYKDQLVLTGKINDVGAYTRTNIENSYRMGIELQASAIINSWFRVASNVSLSSNKVRNFQEFIDDYDNGGQLQNNYSETDLAYSPSVIGSLNLGFVPAKDLNIDLVGKYVSDQYLDNTSNKERMLNAFYSQDLRFSYDLTRLKMPRVNFILQVNNVFDALYEPNGYTYSYYSGGELTTENYYFPMAGRNVMVGVNVKF